MQNPLKLFDKSYKPSFLIIKQKRVTLLLLIILKESSLLHKSSLLLYVVHCGLYVSRAHMSAKSCAYPRSNSFLWEVAVPLERDKFYDPLLDCQ
jgi:hypothetical protein